MALIADLLMVAGTLGAAFYCMVLSRRLQKLSNLDDGMGAAVAVLSQQVEAMTRALERTRAAAQGSAEDLASRTAHAQAAIGRLELLMAALNDLPAREAGAGGGRKTRTVPPGDKPTGKRAGKPRTTAASERGAGRKGRAVAPRRRAPSAPAPASTPAPAAERAP